MQWEGTGVRKFANRNTELVYQGRYVSWLPPDIRRRARIKLRSVFAANSLSDLSVPPSNRLELLRGYRQGQHSIRITDQWRICFYWTDLGSMEIEVTDYH